MATYYVHIPNSEAPTAEVEASSTKHARTAYLDYLSRNGIITWQSRQTVRPLIKASRMNPGETQTQVKLEYSLQEVPTREVQAPPQQLTPEEEERFEEYNTGAAEGLTTEERERFASMGGDFVPTREYPIPPAASNKADLFGSSPIVKLSRKSKGI